VKSHGTVYAVADLPFSFFFFSVRRWASGQDLSTSGSAVFQLLRLQGTFLIKIPGLFLPPYGVGINKNESRHT